MIRKLNFLKFLLRSWNKNNKYLVGDCLVAAAAFLSYAVPFLSSYRDELVDKTWLAEIKKLQMSCNHDFSFSAFMAKPTQVFFFCVRCIQFYIFLD